MLGRVAGSRRGVISAPLCIRLWSLRIVRMDKSRMMVYTMIPINIADAAARYSEITSNLITAATAHTIARRKKQIENIIVKR